MTTEFRKACSCNSTASKGALRLLSRSTPEGVLVQSRVIPGPSCDKCHKPWDELKPCADCGTPVGERHADMCDVERCYFCGGQRISCGCENENTQHSVWSGIWPGVPECREFGWYAVLIPGRGWVSCSETMPGATEDLNRLCMDAKWSVELQRFVLPEKQHEPQP